MSWIITGEQVNPAGDAQITYGITSTGGVFNLRSTGTVDYEVEWGDGTVERSTSNVLAHTYAAGSYVLKIRTAQQYRPYFNSSTDEDQITSVALVSDLDVGTNLANAWFGANNMTGFNAAFGATTGVVDFNSTWRNCSGLTSFPLIDASSGDTFRYAWVGCNQLTTFPLIDTSSGTNFYGAWQSCSGLTSFPLIDTSSGTTFRQAWLNCNSLTDFPANFFDSWTGTPAASCFVNAWDGCAGLTATSVENILNSIDTSLRSAPASGVDITIDYNAASGTPNISTAVSNLKSRGWTITLNGVLQ
jgi:hypothetical protein